MQRGLFKITLSYNLIILFISSIEERYSITYFFKKYIYQVVGPLLSGQGKGAIHNAHIQWIKLFR